MPQTLSIAEARQIAVAAQGLDHPSQRRATSDDVLHMLHRLGCLQIDTIHVVARSPYLVLWSRLGAYDPAWLDNLLPQRQVFEYWAHAASILPIEHWPLFRSTMLRYARGEIGWWRAWQHAHSALLAEVLETIRQRGPLGAADFAAPPGHRGNGWWEWKPAKRALDLLWSAGELMIDRRINFQRRYELRERVLPAWHDGLMPSEAERQQRLAAIALRAMGVATARQLADYFRQPHAETATALEALVADGLAERATVAGWTAPTYVWPAALQALNGPPPTHTTLLSPFDNLIWDRERTRALWNFDYRLECYLPAPQRRFGYFVLPVLWRGRLIARLDAKAERRSGVFKVKTFYFEADSHPDEALDDIAQAIAACAAWHRTPEIVLEHVEPPALREPLLRALHRAADRRLASSGE
ncbi:winged helix-turn-helix domain-containing protein [Kallotenue papyrolyticum]|uniref:winged helix-turn-helix domain-containing protein n=1 Tax=Kallotenue papyrolyticum TaxID=1325125 RepID=UPI0004785B65|nr:winged helix-turn-helix domain-containing protein [Kallotenue papyrolyticum]